jgi:hypothetical protein
MNMRLVRSVIHDAQAQGNDTVHFSNEADRATAVTLLVSLYDSYFHREMEALLAGLLGQALQKDDGGKLTTPGGFEPSPSSLKNNMYNCRKGLTRALYKIDASMAQECERARAAYQADVMAEPRRSSGAGYLVMLDKVTPFLQRLNERQETHGR